MAVCLVDEGTQSYPIWFPDDAPDADCPGYVLVQKSDIPPNPFYLSYADGALVASAIASVWIAAWGIRAVREVLRDRDDA